MVDTAPFVCILLELMPGGELADMIRSRDDSAAAMWHNLDQEQIYKDKILDIALDVLRGLVYLHGFGNAPIIHRDIKPANVLLKEPPELPAKIADLGEARFQATERTMTQVRCS